MEKCLLDTLFYAQYLHWEKLTPFFTASTYNFIVEGDTILFANNNGTYKSTNNGITWKFINYDYLYTAILTKNKVLFAKEGGVSKILRSTDWGETWINTNYNHEMPSSINIDYNDGLWIYTLDSLFYSPDSGNTWILKNCPVQRYNASIISDSLMNIYFASTGGLYKSTDMGVTWTMLSNNSVTYLTVDKTGRLWVTYNLWAVYNNVFVSNDLGTTWIPKGYHYGAKFFFDDSNYVYKLGGSSISKSTDDGITFQKIGIEQASSLHRMKFEGNKIFAIDNTSLYMYDSTFIPLKDLIRSYFPLAVGNKWQFISTRNDVAKIWYTEYKIEVIKDTLIQNKIYYCLTKYPDLPIRYDRDDNKVYVFYNDSDKVYLDFSYLKGHMYTQFDPKLKTDRREYMDKLSLNVFNKNLNVGLVNSNSLFNYEGYEKQYIADSLGFIAFERILYEPRNYPDWNDDIIAANLKDSSGNYNIILTDINLQYTLLLSKIYRILLWY